MCTPRTFGRRRKSMTLSPDERIYVHTCIRCHGIDGKGALDIQLVPKPMDLTSPAVQDRTDASVFKRIHDGKANTAMGAWSYALSDDEIGDVLAYVRTLRSESF